MILDSTFLIDVLRGEDEVADRIERLDASGAPFVSAITVMELAEGIHLAAASDAERAAVEDLLTNVDELPFDRECALEAGRLNADLIRAGDRLDEADVMIAATALVHDYPVVTRNVEYFDRIDSLEVVTY